MEATTIPKTMQAAQLVEFNSKPGYKINQISTPAIGSNDCLIKVAAAGFCHTDYQVLQGVYQSTLPIVPSHEPVGTVVALGEEAAKKWKIGNGVGALLFRHMCGTCSHCEATRDIRFCGNGDFAGLKGDGGMAEYMVGDADNMSLLPDEISFVQGAPLMCAGATVWGGIHASKVKLGEPIGILGIGGLGSLGVQLAKALGHPVVAIDNRPDGREIATTFDLKADLVIDPDDRNAIAKVKDWAGSAGLPALVGCIDNIEANHWGLKLLRPNSTFVPLGLHVDGLRLDAFDLIFQQMTIVGSLVSTKQQAKEMLQCVAKHGIKSWITEVPLQRAGELPELYMISHLKGRLVVHISA